MVAQQVRLESPAQPINFVTYPPAVSVAGYSDSGKTTVAAALVKEMADRGYRVGAIKHCPHGHAPGKEGSDSDRLFRAGALAAIASSPGFQTQTVRVDHDLDLHALVSSLPEVDLVIAEGFRSADVPKILVRGLDGSCPNVANTFAEVRVRQSEETIPVSENDIVRLADGLEEAFQRLDATSESVTLAVDGAPVSLKDFPSRALAGLLRGFVSSLDGVGEPSEIKVMLRRS